MASIIIQEDGRKVQFDLVDGLNSIGRHPDNNIAIAQASVSGRHAAIHVQGDGCTLEDIGSRNGTFVNQQRISEQAPLKPVLPVLFSPCEQHHSRR